MERVAPPAGAWIETASFAFIKNAQSRSRPPRARGLKQVDKLSVLVCHVAPPAGAWIETPDSVGASIGAIVAPPAGAWIETWKI